MMCFVTFLCSFSIFVQLLSTTSVFVTYISCLSQALINVLNVAQLHKTGCNKTVLPLNDTVTG